MTSEIPFKLLSGECHRTPLMINQHWLLLSISYNNKHFGSIISILSDFLVIPLYLAREMKHGSETSILNCFARSPYQFQYQWYGFSLFWNLIPFRLTWTDYSRQVVLTFHMMTLSNGSMFRVTDPLWGESTGHQWIPSQSPVTRSFDVFFDLRLNKRLSKRSRRRWFKTPPGSLWRHCNEAMGSELIHYSASRCPSI